MLHPNQDLLLRFSVGATDEAAALRIVSHLGECRPCTERLQALQSLRRDFDGAWESFQSEVEHRASLAVGVQAPGRITVLVAFRGLLERSSRLATAAVEQLGSLGGSQVALQARFAPAYSGVADSRKSAEALEEVKEASAAVARGNLAGALEHLRRAAATDPEISASAGVDVYFGSEVAGRIVVDGTRGSVSVLVYPDVLPVTGGRAVLEAVSGQPETDAPLALPPGASYLLAEFDDLPDGEFTLRVEVQGV